MRISDWSSDVCSSDLRDELAARIADAETAGVRRERIIVDPGLGFAKRGTHNWDLLRDLSTLDELGLPVLIGASRKSFLGALLADDEETPRPVEGREAANTALTTLVAQLGRAAGRARGCQYV